LSGEILNDTALPWVNYVTTKEALSKFAAKLYPAPTVRKHVATAVHKALSKPKSAYPLYVLKSPVTLKIEFISTSMADVACYVPKVKRLDGRTIEYKQKDYAVMFEAMMALITLASAANLA
jgi:D-amino peptidase